MLRLRIGDGRLGGVAGTAAATGVGNGSSHTAAALRRRFFMDYDVGIPISRAASHNESPSPVSPSFNEDALWQMSLRSREVDSGPYPIREGEPDCSYYIRTGLCRFGPTCRYNHPSNRRLAISAAQVKGDFPERVGQPECQYYLKNGTCKFGPTCKFHHPKDKAGAAGKIELNVLGYPIREGEVECPYYLRTGQCKYGSTCKFHHPQPSNTISASSSPAHPLNSPTIGQQQAYQGGLTNWPMSRASFIASPRWQGPSSYTPLVLSQGVVSVPGWNAYSVQLSSSSPESQQQSTGNSVMYRTSHQSGAPNAAGSQGAFSAYPSGSLPVGYYALQSESIFPERPGQPECQFYMKTGDCKFGAVCKFHHPRERLNSTPDSVLSPIGLPLRPGEPLCVFYSRYGICKFGPSCKFDHPMGVFTYSLSVSSPSEAPVVRRLMGSSSGNGALGLGSESLVDAGSLKARRLSFRHQTDA